MSRELKYVVHPGWINSKVSGDRHYVGINNLVRLYQLRPGEFVKYDDRRPDSHYEGLIALHPRPDGQYGRP